MVSTSYLLPCCWCDLKSTFDGKQGALSELVKEHLHIDKVNSIDEVLDTPEWKNFHKVITADKTTNETLRFVLDIVVKA